MFAIVGSIVSLCLGATFAKRLFPIVGFESTTLYRIGFAALMLLLIWRPWRLHFAPRRFALLMLFGAALGAMNLSFYASLRTLPLGVAIALEFVGPLAVAIGSSRRAIDFLWIGLAVTGVGLLLPVWRFSEPLDVVGTVFALTAGALWAVYILLGRHVGRSDPGASLSVAMTAGALFVLPFAMLARGGDVGTLLAPAMLMPGLGLALLSSLVPYTLELYALPRLPAATFSVLLSLEPAVGALLGTAVSGERLTTLQWLAIGCVVTASAGKAVGARGARNVAAAAQ